MPKKGQSEPLSWFASNEDCLHGEERLWQQLATLDAEQSTRAWMPSTNLVERKNLVDIVSTNLICSKSQKKTLICSNPLCYTTTSSFRYQHL
jgi:hypothetical protein